MHLAFYPLSQSANKPKLKTHNSTRTAGPHLRNIGDDSFPDFFWKEENKSSEIKVVFITALLQCVPATASQ